MTQDTTLNTTIDEPSMTAGEAEMLRFALQRSRGQFAWKVDGLDSAALNAAHPPSAMTIGGLIKHLAGVEDQYTCRFLTGVMHGPWTASDFEADPEWDWHSAADDSPEELYALWSAAVDNTNAAVARWLAEGGLDQPTRVGPNSGESPNLRRVLVDLHDEYARHVGHADLLREAIDGLVGEDPPQ